VSGERRKMHNEELHDLCYSPNISASKSKEDEMIATCNTHRIYETLLEDKKRREHLEDLDVGGRKY
jgi:hypothetical protein